MNIPLQLMLAVDDDQRRDLPLLHGFDRLGNGGVFRDGFGRRGHDVVDQPVFQAFAPADQAAELPAGWAKQIRQPIMRYGT